MNPPIKGEPTVKPPLTATPTITPTTPKKTAKEVFLMANSNIDEVVRWLEDWVTGVDFTRPGKDQSLGRDIANKVAEQIATRSATESRGATAAWPPNSPGYSAAKQKDYGWSLPNYRTGQMLSHLSLIGRTRIAAHEVTMVYGIDAPPSAGGSPTGLVSAADSRITDTEKAAFAHSGQSRQRIQRPFYELDDLIREAVVVDVVAPWVSAYVVDTNHANGV